MNGDELANPVKYLGGEEFFIVGGLTKRELIAAMAMKGLLANPGFREDVVHGRIAKMAIYEANNLIYHLNAHPVAEGVNVLPMYSRELDEGLDNDQDRGASR
jgi:hypothetical protein